MNPLENAAVGKDPEHTPLPLSKVSIGYSITACQVQGDCIAVNRNAATEAEEMP